MSLLIPCPQCSRELKLPDRSLLGRKGKCPKCGHSFILEAPAAVEAPTAVAIEVAKPESESRRLETVPEIPPPPAFMSKPVTSSLNDPRAQLTSMPEFEAFERITHSGGSASRSSRFQKRHTIRNLGLAITAAILTGAGGLVVFLTQNSSTNTPSTTDNTESVSTETGSMADGDVGRQKVDPTATHYANLGVPTKGKPIELQYIPFGTQVVLNLHPAELWKESSLGEEVRFCAPEIAKLVEATLNDLFNRKPSEVEELLICLIPGPRGTPPDVAAVAHLVEEQKRSQLIQEFGQRNDKYSEPIFVSKNHAYMIPDLKTLVVCPQNQAEEMVQAVKERHPVNEIDPLLPLTDRDRHVTVIFTPMTLGLQDSWYPENVRPFVKNATEWLGDEAETVCWSFHLTEDLFYSDLLIRHRGLRAKDYESEFKGKVARLAGSLVSVIEQMNPKEQGKRMVIGRFPAMVEVFSMATIAHHGPYHVQFVTPLPDRAAANMVLGTYLTWDESTRTDFSKAKPATTDGSAVPALVADRLKMKIEIDFRNTPFNEAFAYIGGEIKTPIDLDGDSLKLGGFTKNIKQEFKLDSARAQDAIVKIFEASKGVDVNPEKNLVLVVDESKKRILVTTLAGAGRKSLKPFELK